MKRKIYLISLILSLCLFDQVLGQSRKFISQFSHFQSYFNPGLTGYEGSALRGFVRNQWSGVEGAPKTYFLSMELDFGEMGGLEDPALMGKNSMSVNMLHDTYGAFRESELIIAYASRIRLTARHNLRLGAGFNYMAVRLDGNSLTSEQLEDTTIEQYLGGFANMQILDFNLGLALTHKDYYLSYGMHNVNRGRFSRGDILTDGRPVSIMVQGGYRQSVNEHITLIGNFFYRTQSEITDNIEGNVKALLMDVVWLGGGYRHQFAHNYQIGFLLPSLRIGYVYEIPLNKQLSFLGQTHEFMLVLNIFQKDKKEQGLGMW